MVGGGVCLLICLFVFATERKTEKNKPTGQAELLQKVQHSLDNKITVGSDDNWSYSGVVLS